MEHFGMFYDILEYFVIIWCLFFPSGILRQENLATLIQVNISMVSLTWFVVSEPTYVHM
jgi:hypothetical protein